MFKISICDDEIIFVDKLKSMIVSYMEQNQLEFELYGTDSCKELLANIEQTGKPDLLFLDVEMDEQDGISIAEQLRKRFTDICVVFVSGYIRYAIDGYRVNAFRYILKEELDHEFVKCMDAVMEYFHLAVDLTEMPFLEGQQYIHPHELLYIESNAHKIFFYSCQSQIIGSMNRKLDELEHQYTEYGFCRVHKSYLVNLRYVKNISSYKLTLQDGKVISVPKARYNQVKQEYALYKGEIR